MKKTAFLVFVVLLFVVACGARAPITKTEFLLDTISTVTIYDITDGSLLDGAFAVCREYEDKLSRTKEQSDIYKINNAGGQTTSVSPETAEIINKSLAFCRLGGFDISVEPLTALWDFGNSPKEKPNDDDIKRELLHIGFEKIKISQNSVTLADEGAGLDLGAIAKGYIADKMGEHLISRGVKSAIINLGGNVLAIGSKPGGGEWTIGIQKPFESRGALLASIKVRDVSVVTTGIYEKFFREGDALYHHILDPETGYPFENSLAAVTVISKSSADADALGTVCFARGLEKGLEFAEGRSDIEAIFITKDNVLYPTSGVGSKIPIELENGAVLGQSLR